MSPAMANTCPPERSWVQLAKAAPEDRASAAKAADATKAERLRPGPPGPNVRIAPPPAIRLRLRRRPGLRDA